MASCERRASVEAGAGSAYGAASRFREHAGAGAKEEQVGLECGV